MVVALVVLGFVLRRLSKEGGGKPTAKTKHIQSGRPVPNENPARGAVKKPQEVQEFDAVNVRRPTMLALTTVREDAVSPEVFIQRAFKIDREHWMEIESTDETRRNLEALFSHVCQLAWVPGSAFERHIYSVSFAPALEAALKEGIFRNDKSAGVVTHVTAIDETGEVLGNPMKMSLAGSKLGLVAALWAAFNPKGMPHELRAELEKENAEVAKRLADLPLSRPSKAELKPTGCLSILPKSMRFPRICTSRPTASTKRLKRELAQSSISRTLTMPWFTPSPICTCAI